MNIEKIASMHKKLQKFAYRVHRDEFRAEPLIVMMTRAIGPESDIAYFMTRSDNGDGGIVGWLELGDSFLTIRPRIIKMAKARVEWAKLSPMLAMVEDFWLEVDPIPPLEPELVIDGSAVDIWYKVGAKDVYCKSPPAQTSSAGDEILHSWEDLIDSLTASRP